MPKINSSSVKICESSQKVLAQFSPASRPKILNCYPRSSNKGSTKVCFSGIKIYVFLRENSLFFVLYLEDFFKAKKKIPIGMFFDEANFIAELFWRASSPV